MLELVASDELSRRHAALRQYDTFARPGEIEPLLRFRNDDSTSELRPLGDWEYDLRNRAFVLAEKYSGQRFPRILRAEPYEGVKVTWFYWTPVVEWHNRHPKTSLKGA